jgi:hypothetical protein
MIAYGQGVAKKIHAGSNSVDLAPRDLQAMVRAARAQSVWRAAFSRHQRRKNRYAYAGRVLSFALRRGNRLLSNRETVCVGQQPAGSRWRDGQLSN